MERQVKKLRARIKSRSKGRRQTPRRDMPSGVEPSTEDVEETEEGSEYPPVLVPQQEVFRAEPMTVAQAIDVLREQADDVLLEGARQISGILKSGIHRSLRIQVGQMPCAEPDHRYGDQADQNADEDAGRREERLRRKYQFRTGGSQSSIEGSGILERAHYSFNTKARGLRNHLNRRALQPERIEQQISIAFD